MRLYSFVNIESMYGLVVMCLLLKIHNHMERERETGSETHRERFRCKYEWE